MKNQGWNADKGGEEETHKADHHQVGDPGQDAPSVWRRGLALNRGPLHLRLARTRQRRGNPPLLCARFCRSLVRSLFGELLPHANLL
jgi:hypothetical protein